MWAMRGLGELEAEVALGQARPQLVDLDLHDALDVRLAQPVEHHDLVDAVEELGLEVVAHHVHDHALVGAAAEVARHDEHGVGEVDGATLAVGEAAVVEQLEQHVEHVGVGLLDLVEQHDRVRAGAAPPR